MFRLLADQEAHGRRHACKMKKKKTESCGGRAGPNSTRRTHLISVHDNPMVKRRSYA